MHENLSNELTKLGDDADQLAKRMHFLLENKDKYQEDDWKNELDKTYIKMREKTDALIEILRKIFIKRGGAYYE